MVDEYDGDTLSGSNERDSTEPLTLAELTKFFLGSWSLMDCLGSNFETATEQILAFFDASSQSYPDLDRLLRERVLERFQTVEDDDDDT